MADNRLSQSIPIKYDVDGNPYIPVELVTPIGDNVIFPITAGVNVSAIVDPAVSGRFYNCSTNNDVTLPNTDLIEYVTAVQVRALHASGVTVFGNGNTINGAATYTLVQYECVKFGYCGGEWALID